MDIDKLVGSNSAKRAKKVRIEGKWNNLGDK